MTSSPEFNFLLSSDRSGSNLLLKLINAHPDFCAPPTSQLSPALSKHLSRYGELKDDTNWRNLVEDMCQLHRAGYGTWKNYGHTETLINHVKPRSLANLLKSIYRAESRTFEKPRLFIKLHKAYEYADFLIENFPDAKYVHLVRDPRDMALSWKKTPGLRGGCVRAADIWQTEQNGIIEFRQIISSQTLQVRYEDILSDAKSSLKRICIFMGIQYTEDMHQFYLDSNTRNDAQSINAWKNLANPINTNNSGKYKTELSQEEIRYIELKCATAMKEHQYQFSDSFNTSNQNIDSLRKTLQPMELWEKKIYALLPEEERNAHRRLSEAIHKIKNRRFELQIK